MTNNYFLKLLIASVATISVGWASPPVKNLEVQIEGGHETLTVDRGRPVVLISAALQVSPEVFRKAFSRVRPAPAGQEPDPNQVGANKRMLLDALGKLGVTNERLDAVSDHYRYQPGSGELWPHRSAIVHVKLEGCRIVSCSVIDPGNGYSSKPKLTVPGHPEIRLEAQLRFGTDFGRNGSVVNVTVVSGPRTKKP